MALRKIDLPAPDWSNYQKEVLDTWESINCRLVTPAYGGGTVAAEPDTQYPIRAAAIRGQLRFWWRLLAKQNKQKWNLNGKNLRDAEFALWGGMGSSDDDGNAGLVFLRVKQLNLNPPTVPYTQYTPKLSDTLSYVLFPARTTDVHLLEKGLEWTLLWRFDETRISTVQKEQVYETLRWWATFGGIGARTRRGCGAFEVLDSSCSQLKQLVDIDEVHQAGCKLVTHTANGDAVAAWKSAVGKLRDFRQKPHVGRNPPSSDAPPGVPAGRSRWPEPDALRRLSKKHHDRHKPNHEAGNIAPRAIFGLPIIISFKDMGDPGKNIQLRPKHNGKTWERLPSPLILRPIKQGDTWLAAALVLPYQDLMKLSVEAKGGALHNEHIIPLWQPETAEKIKPIQENGGGNPLMAFLEYFKK